MNDLRLGMNGRRSGERHPTLIASEITYFCKIISVRCRKMNMPIAALFVQVMLTETMARVAIKRLTVSMTWTRSTNF